jgi:hypothetical protein
MKQILCVCGYASNSVYKKIDCLLCQCSIREAKGDEVGCPFFDSLQRFLGNFVIKRYSFFMTLQSEKKN